MSHSNIPVHITSRRVELNDDTVELIHRRARALTKVRPDVLRCEVTVDVPHRSRRKGRRFRVGVSVITTDEVVSTNRQLGAEREHENLGVAVNHAFRTVRRQLTDRYQRRPGCCARWPRRSRGRELRHELDRRWSEYELSDNVV